MATKTAETQSCPGCGSPAKIDGGARRRNSGLHTAQADSELLRVRADFEEAVRATMHDAGEDHIAERLARWPDGAYKDRSTGYAWWGYQQATARAQPAPAAQEHKEASHRYRLLVPEVDRIEASDEFLSDDTLTWAADPNAIFAGMIYGGRVLRPSRRQIAA